MALNFWIFVYIWHCGTFSITTVIFVIIKMAMQQSMEHTRVHQHSTRTFIKWDGTSSGALYTKKLNILKQIKGLPISTTIKI